MVLAGNKLPAYAVPRRKDLGETKVNVSLRIPQRLYLYTRDRFEFTRTVESALRQLLIDTGIDLSLPHELEVVAHDDKGQPMTFARAKQEGLFDVRGRPIEEPGVDHGTEGAVL